MEVFHPVEPFQARVTLKARFQPAHILRTMKGKPAKYGWNSPKNG